MSCGIESPRTANNDIIDADPLFALEPVFGGRLFDRPVEIGAYPSGRLLVAQQPGTVLLLQPDGSGAVSTLLNISDRVEIERGEGLLSVALDPGFEQNGYLWAYYYADEPARSVLARYEVRDDIADADTELVVLDLPQPGTNQNGGAIRFGPRDGMLYLTLGDGSASFDPFENGQNPETLLGSVVRLDVSASTPEQPYAVPDDNPFVGEEGYAPEVWAWGVRNPWRAAFDPETGKLWGGDVMAGAGEEVNIFAEGKNYGWNRMEGFRCVGQADCQGFELPVAAYNHDDGRCAVTGGVVYRGEAIPELHGLYLFADFCTGDLMALDADDPDDIMLLSRVEGGLVTSFGLDAAGEIYVTSFQTGVWKLVPR
jgi:glucose/arabinose dehydrogenase